MIGFGLSRSFALSALFLVLSGAADNVSVIIRDPDYSNEIHIFGDDEGICCSFDLDLGRADLSDPDEFAEALTKDAAFPKRMGRPEEYGRLAVAIVENPMLNGGTIRLDGGQHFAPK